MSQKDRPEESLRKMRLNPGLMEIVTIDLEVLRVDRFIIRGSDPRGFAVKGNRIYVRSRTDRDLYASVDDLFSS